MKYLFYLAALLVSAGLHGQTCDIEVHGHVIDTHTQAHIPFVKLLVEHPAVKLVTSESGDFRIKNVCQGELIIRCLPCVDCDTIEYRFQIEADTHIVLNTEIHVQNVEELSVSAFRFHSESLPEMEINTREMTSIQGTTLADNLTRIPGVTTLNTGASIAKPVINGMYGNRVVTVNNGIRQEGQQWGSEHAPEIDPNLAASLKVIRGAAGLRYGPDAIGGVVIVSPDMLKYHHPASGWVKMTGNTNGWGSGIATQFSGNLFKSHNFAYRVNGSARINGTQAAPDYLIRNTAMNEYSYSAALGYKGNRFEVEGFYSQFSTNLGIFTGSHIGNLTDLQAAFAAKVPKDSGVFTYQLDKPMQRIVHHLSKLTAQYRWNEKSVSRLTYGYQLNWRREYDLHKAYNDSLAALNKPAFELNLWTNTLDLNTMVRHTRFVKSEFGFSGLEQSNAYDGRYFIPNFRKWQYGIYYIGGFEKGRWNLDYGVRYDVSKLKVFIYEQNVLRTPEKSYGHFSGSIGGSRTFGKHLAMNLNAGTAWRPPSVNELYSNGLHHGAAAIEEGDTSIDKEVVYSLQYALQAKFNRLNAHLSLFYNHFDGYIFLQPDLPPKLTIVGAFPVFSYTQAQVRLYGINGLLSWDVLKSLNYEVSGSWVIADNLDTGEPVYGIPSGRIMQRLRYTGGFGKERWKWQAEINGLAVFRQNRYEEGSDYVAPPDGYFLLGGQIGISRKSQSGDWFQLVLNCTNMTNLSYRDYMNRFRYFTDEIGRNWSLKLFIPINFN